MAYPVFASGDTLLASDMNAVGKWLVTSGTITTVSSVTVNNCFTSTYRNYEIVFSATASAASGYVTVQFTVSGTATTTNYLTRTAQFYAASLGYDLQDNVAGTDEIAIGLVGGTTPAHTLIRFTVGSPQLAQPTQVIASGPGSFGGNACYTTSNQGVQTASTQFDGIKIIFPGNVSGTYRIYGLRD